MASYEVGTAYVAIMPQTKGLTRELSNSISSSGFAGACAKEGKAGGDGLVSKLKGALKVAAFVGIGKEVGSKLMSGITSAINEYADYEQLVGGVDKLFGDEAADIVKKNADEAFMSAGLSANAYMETVTGFSASLINSLEGDTVRAAQLSDQAIRDMSDNANTFGSDIESIQNAYAGFAKGNFTMLDNLKLGYGGTASEMVRLINDSGVLNESISSLDGIGFDTIIEAIHAVQEQTNIAGTTAKEAAGTISGSASAMSASWSNLVAEMGKDDADIQGKVDSFVGSLTNYVTNIATVLPVIVGNIMTAIPLLIQGVTPVLYEKGVEFIGQLLLGIATKRVELAAFVSTLVADVATWIGNNWELVIAKGSEAIQAIITGITTTAGALVSIAEQIIPSIALWIGENWDGIVAKGTEIISSIVSGITQTAGELMSLVMELVPSIVGWIGDNWDGIVAKGGEVIGSIISGISQAAGDLMTLVTNIVPTLVSWIGDNWEDVKSKGLSFIGGLLSGITEKRDGDLQTELLALPGKLVEYVGDTVTSLGAKGREFVQGFLNGISEFVGSDLAATLATFPVTVATFVGETINALFELGRDFIAGFLTGATDKRDVEGADFFGGLLDYIKGLITTGIDVATFLNSIGSDMIAGFLDGVTGGKWTDLKKWFGDLPGELKKKIGNVTKKLLQKGKDYLQGFKDGVENIGSQVGTWFTSLPDTLKGLLGSLTTKLVQKGKDILQGLFDGIKNIFEKPDGVSNFFSNLMETIKGLIPDPIGALVGIGEDVINGFLTGIQNISLKPILETIFGTDLANTICGVLGIESPSKVTKEFGKYTTQGFANGLKDSEAVGQVTANARSLKDDVTGGLGDTSSLLYGKGKGATNSFASGVGEWFANKNVEDQAAGVRKKVTDKLSEFDSWTWGNHLVNNFAAGMEYARSTVEQTSITVSSAIQRIFGHSVPQVGPMSDDDEWGLHFVQNITDGMLKGKPLLEQTAKDLAYMVDSTVNGDYSVSYSNVMQPKQPIDISGNNFYIRDENDIENVAQRLYELVNRVNGGALA